MRDLLGAYEEAPSIDEAERILDQLAAESPAEVELGDLYDDLAEAAAEEEDFAVASRLQRKAIEHGCEHPELAREMLGWYLLKDGQRDAGEALFAELRAERPDDPELLLTLGNARADAGRERDALEAFEESLALAKRLGAEHAITRARGEREFSRTKLGLMPDEDDLLAPRPSFAGDEETRWSLAWFPRDQREAALDRWPDLEGDLRDPDAYCRGIERGLRRLHVATGRRPSIAPIDVEELVAFAAGEGLSAGDGQTRSRFAAELYRTGASLPWPPGRNNPCWCGSGRKYKRCCAGA